MQRRIPSLVLCVVLLVVAGPAAAVAAGDLFAAETLVSDEGSESRNAALAELLATVMVRVSGNSAVAGQPAARELLARAPSLVQQYRYRSAERDGTVARYLWARFDQATLERLMRERQLPVWTQRPRVLLWVATEQSGQRSLLNFDAEPVVRAAATAKARQRGMPLQLPLMDLEDQTALTPADVWSDYQTAIRRASARYPHELILTGRLRDQGDGQWRGVWSLIGPAGSQSFQTPAQTLDQATAFAVDQTQTLLAARYAPLAGGAGATGTLVRFSDVYDLAAYGRLVALLDGLEPVARSALRHVQADGFWFELQLRGSPEDLQRALDVAAGVVAEPGPRRSVFAPAARTDSTASPAASPEPPEADLYYRLLN